MTNTNTISFTRIANSTSGNPRYVCHFINLLTEAESEMPFELKYNHAIKRANKLGGRKYHTKRYGGGIVFQSYNLDDTERSILNAITNC